jgi:hypothetical protein
VAGGGDVTIPYAAGRIVGPDGKQPAGATAQAVYPGPVITGSYTTDGNFSVAVGRLVPRDGAMNGPLGVIPFKPVGVTVVANGFGLGWMDGAEITGGKVSVVRLVEDCVVSGRVLCPDGRPLAGATVRVEEVRAYPVGGAKGVLKGLTAKGKDRPASVSWAGPFPADVGTAESDHDGRFRLTRLGRDRVIRLRIEGTGAVPATISVVTVKHKADDLPLPARDEAGRPTFGPEFEFRLSPPSDVK